MRSVSEETREETSEKVQPFPAAAESSASLFGRDDATARRARALLFSERFAIDKNLILMEFHLMLCSHRLRRPLVFLPLLLLLFGAGRSASAQTWEPVSTGFATEIVVATSGGNTSVQVTLTCPNAGYRVSDWGQVVRAGNDFSVDARVERWTGVSAQMIITISHTYTLGALTPGTYSFAVKANGTVVKTQAFTIGTAAPSAPTLLTEDKTDRAIAVESVTLLRGPFDLASARQFSTDGAKRLVLFATDIPATEDPSIVTGQAEDSQGRIYPVTVEYIGRPTNAGQLIQIVIKLPAELKAGADIPISLNVRGVTSNKVLISINPPSN